MAQDRAPTAFHTDRCALPQKLGGEHRPTDATMGTGNGGTRHVLSRVGVSRCQLHGVLGRIPQEAKAWGNAQDMPTCGR
jgi:hypothetical protein